MSETIRNQRRIAEIDLERKPCMIYGCKWPTNGLSKRYCRHHRREIDKYGSPLGRMAFKLTDRERRRAQRWMRNNPDDPYLKAILQTIQNKLDSAPERVHWKHWVGKPHDWRVHRTWGHFKAKGVKPEKLVEDWMTYYLAWLRPDQPNRDPKFRHHATGRALARHTGGTWLEGTGIYFKTLPDGTTGLFRYKDRRKQRPQGHYAKALGREFDKICDTLVDNAAPFKKYLK